MSTKAVAYTALLLLVSRILVMTRSQQQLISKQLYESCPPPFMPENGQVSCFSAHSSGDDTELLCTYICDSGYKFSGLSDTSIYRQCSNGVFTDGLDPPECIYSETLHNPGISVCTAWGQDHYRTFDNTIYTFKGHCKYVLAYVPNTFSIMVVNDPLCTNIINCKRDVEIYFGENSVVLRSTQNGSVVLWNNEVFPVPGSRGGTVIEKIGSYTTVRSSLKFSLKWDASQSVFIKVSDELKGQVSGLCGRFNGNPADDFENDKGNVVTSVASFATSWKKTELNAEMCGDSVQTLGCNIPVKSSLKVLAKSKCGDLLHYGNLIQCHKLVDPGPYLEACMYDCCEKNTTDCTCCMCGSIEAYSRACLEQGLKVSWRRPGQCDVHCPGPMVYKECGSPCVPDCSNMDAGCSDPTCVDGCFCPDGWVLHKGQCIESSQCPCTRGNTEYEHGSIINEECNSCSCVLGKWNCTHKDCDAVCSIMGDNHFSTFDGHRYDFMGLCSYYLVQTADFNIVVDSFRCGNGEAACTKSLSIDFKGITIKLDHNHQLIINGVKIVNNSYQSQAVHVCMVSSLFMQVFLSNGVSVMWDGRTRTYIKVPPTLKGHTQGLCGTYDGRQNNDFLTPQGSIESNAKVFGNMWKTTQDCEDVPLTISALPCETQSQTKVQATQLCSILKGSLFEACHNLEDVTHYYTDCMYDLCSCAGHIQDCLCPSLATYADVCATKGAKINWRQQVKKCMLQCPGGQVYQVCGRPCKHTCHSLAQNTDSLCDMKCVEGCSCPEGQTLNNHGECVLIEQCPCAFNGHEYPAGYTTMKGTDLCVCTNAQWQCSRIQADNKDITEVEPICKGNLEYSTCVSSCPVTCENVESALTCDREKNCQTGCVCRIGYVLDGNKCILPSMCPCYHGGKNYYEGDTFYVDCNECVCKSRKWQCEKNECPSTCSAYGDSHYTSFDGRVFEFQGSCDYIMTKSSADNSQKFLITTTNVLCGTSGVACSKAIEFFNGTEESGFSSQLKLIKGESVIPEPGSSFSVREIGEMIYVTTPFGVSIQWDKGTRVYVRLSSLHIGKVEGLCGNFNGDQKDDFQMRSGGLPVAKATSFGDSWRVHSTCETSKEIVDTCLLAPQRRSWAQHQCSVIASDLFKSCHTFVDPKEYISRCEFDVCGCDMGGDCECLCTAIAAYAHECANQDMPIKWRSKDLCGLTCSDCKAYNPCISVCPKETCDNSHNYSRIADSCDDEHLCFEGCDFNACPEGQVYDSLVEPVKCIPRHLCASPSCVVGEKNYRDGERIDDPHVCNSECETCICRHGHIEHTSFATCTTNTEGYLLTSPAPPRTMPAGDSTTVSSENTQELSTQRLTDHTPCSPVNREGKVCEMIGVSNQLLISNDQLEASSSEDAAFDAHNGRLRSKPSWPGNGGAWKPRASDHTPHLIIDLKDLREVDGIATQGRSDFPEWVESYTVTISKDGVNFSSYLACDSDTPKVFVANNDSNSVAQAFFDRKMWVRKIAIYPKNYVNAIAMRVDLLTCHDTPLTTQEVDTSTPEASTIFSSASSNAHIDRRSTWYSDFTSALASTVSSTLKETTATSKQQASSSSPFYITEESTSSVTDKDKTTKQYITTTSIGSDVNTKCQWSDWLNADRPNSSLSDLGDLETIEVLKHKFSFCPDIRDIECRVAGSATSALNAGQTGVKCDIFNGLRCYNNDMVSGLCYDYEVRLCLDSHTCKGFTAKTDTITVATTPFYSSFTAGTDTAAVATTPFYSSTAVCPPGEEWDPCAYKCNEVCHSMGHAAGACSEPSLEECVPGCRSASPKCLKGQRLLDQNSCVDTVVCTCLKSDGTVAKPFENWIDSVNSCSRCSCFNNKVECVPEYGCTSEAISTDTTENISTVSRIEKVHTGETFEATQSAGTTKPSQTEGTTRSTQAAGTIKPSQTEGTTGSTQAAGTTKPSQTEGTTHISRCHTWSSWINDDKPNTGSGDSELISVLQSKYSLCVSPIAVECRDAITGEDVQASGQHVSCTKKEGLQCINADNGDKCKDYEIRVFCPCPITELISVSSTFTTSSSDTSPTSSSQSYTTSSALTTNVPTPTIGPTSTNGPISTNGPTSTNGSPSQSASTSSSSVSSSTSGFLFYSSASLPSTSKSSYPTDTTESSSPASATYRISTDTSSTSNVFSKRVSSSTSATMLILPENSDTTVSSILTSPSSPTTETAVSTESTTPSARVVCSWTNWMSDHSPDAYGDMETILQLRHRYSFCKTSDILAVRCRDSNTKKTPEELGQFNVQCEINPGLVCINSNQLHGQCADYEVSFLCDPQSPACSFQTTTGNPQSTVAVEPTTHDSTYASSSGTTQQQPQCFPETCKQNMILREDMLSASSFHNAGYAPGHAILGDASSWIPAATDTSPYIQINFMTLQLISGITTQGHVSSFVRTYIINYSTDGIKWHPYREIKGQERIFNGNIDATMPVRNLFQHLIRARYLQIIPLSWNNEIALRFQIHGCPETSYDESYRHFSGTTAITPTAFPGVTNVNKFVNVSKNENCTEWDQWLDLNHPNLTHTDETEPIADLIANSLFCKNPMAIECSPEPFVRPQTSTSTISCNLWKGVKCSVSDGNGPICMNYKARLGCLKETPECTSRVTDHSPVPVCYPELDTSFCPQSCQQGFYCNGTSCVPRSLCPCNINGKIVMPHSIDKNENCDICQCQNGELMCAEMPKCPCAQGIGYRATGSCECQCLTCKADQFQCGDGSCISADRKCDCIIDCIDDELECNLTKPYIQSYSSVMTTALVTNSTVTSTTKSIPETFYQPTTDILRCTYTHEFTTNNVQLTEPQVKVYMAGETWADGMCKHCTCSNGSIIVCTIYYCPSCPLGEEKSQTEDSCCGRCTPVGCVVGSHVYKAGESLPSSKKCYTAACEKNNDTFMIHETQVYCETNLPYCLPGVSETEAYDITGCCHNCTSPPPTPPLTNIRQCTYTHNFTTNNVQLTEPQVKVYMAGETWTDGMCKHCTCSNGSSIICTEHYCLPCPLGEERSQTEDSCCGKCTPVGCVVDSHVYKAGESLPSSKECYTAACEKNNDTFIIHETQVYCETNLPYCLPGVSETEAYDITGCCRTCTSPPPTPPLTTVTPSTCKTCSPQLVTENQNDTIGYFKVLQGNTTCQNKEPIPDLKQCSGYCGSSSSFPEILNASDSSCTCCQPSRTVSRSVQLHCSNGKLTIYYIVPETCWCMPCPGGI